MIARFGWRFHLGRFTRARLLMVCVTLLIFVLAHGWSGDTLGAVEDVLALLPLLVAAWLLGHAGSLLTFGVVVILHFVLSYAVGESMAVGFINNLPGIIAGFVVSFTVGWLSDLLTRMEEENAKRQKVEAELRLLNDELEQRTLNRTAELTESKKMIERAKKEWEATVDALSDLILLTNEEGVVVRCNRATVVSLQKEYDDVLNHPLWDLFCDEGQNCQAVFGVPSAEHQFQNLAGWHHILNLQAHWGDGKLYYVHIIRDITARKQAQAELQAEHDFALTVLNTMGQGLTVLDSNGKFEYVNPAYARMLGYLPEELIGHSPGEFTIEEDQATLAQTRERRLKGETTTYETRLRRRDGGNVIAHITGVPRWSEGKVVGAITVIADLTELKSVQAAMIESQKLADLGTLSAGVAHEMNSPLQVITGVSQMVLRQIDCARLDMNQLRSDLEMISRNGWRCAEIVRSLRAYAHTSSDLYATADLNEIVRDTLLLIRHQLKVWSNIFIVTDLAPGLPNMECDRNRITQVLINMITNARDAMPNGGEITMHTRYDSLRDRLILEIADTGSGIPEAAIGKIFDPFFTTKPIGQGTGLGLSIVAGILRAHGGEVQVTSVLGEGTKFAMSFPLKQVTLPVLDEAHSEAAGRFDQLYTDLPSPI